MIRYCLLVVVAGIFLNGCGGSSSNNNDDNGDDTQEVTLENSFADRESYGRDSFTLSTDSEYWAVVYNESEISDEPTLYFHYEYDTEVYSSLSDDAKNNLQTSFSDEGFEGLSCYPEYCPAYVVSIGSEGDVTIINSVIHLADFFAPIDTEAEVNLYLWANNLEPKTFESVDGGYRATVEATTCDYVKTNLVYLDHNGVITAQEELDHEEFETPECA